MAGVRELHSHSGVVVEGGGLKEFYYSPEEIQRIKNSDTSSTKEFKKWYYLHLFYNRKADAADLYTLKERVPFYKLTITVYNKKNNKKIKKFLTKIRYQNAQGVYTEFLSFECRDNFVMDLPENKYQIQLGKKILFFYSMRQIKDINLSKDVNEKIIL